MTFGYELKNADLEYFKNVDMKVVRGMNPPAAIFFGLLGFLIGFLVLYRQLKTPERAFAFAVYIGITMWLVFDKFVRALDAYAVNHFFKYSKSGTFCLTSQDNGFVLEQGNIDQIYLFADINYFSLLGNYVAIFFKNREIIIIPNTHPSQVQNEFIKMLSEKAPSTPPKVFPLPKRRIPQTPKIGKQRIKKWALGAVTSIAVGLIVLTVWYQFESRKPPAPLMMGNVYTAGFDGFYAEILDPKRTKMLFPQEDSQALASFYIENPNPYDIKIESIDFEVISHEREIAIDKSELYYFPPQGQGGGGVMDSIQADFKLDSSASVEELKFKTHTTYDESDGGMRNQFPRFLVLDKHGYLQLTIDFLPLDAGRYHGRFIVSYSSRGKIREPILSDIFEFYVVPNEFLLENGTRMKVNDDNFYSVFPDPRFPVVTIID